MFKLVIVRCMLRLQPEVEPGLFTILVGGDAEIGLTAP
jgi:hypothetical protein